MIALTDFTWGLVAPRVTDDAATCDKYEKSTGDLRIKGCDFTLCTFYTVTIICMMIK